ncbi:MAG: 50S ribosomal protein L4, partial [Promethearchaeota archaeon]
IAATVNEGLIKKRGHKIEGIKDKIMILDDKVQTIKKTKNIVQILEALGLKNVLDRCKIKKIRAGKGKRRGRKYRRKKGPLIVAENYGIYNASKNIPGIDVVSVNNLSVEHLAPGGNAGRLTIWTESSIKALENKRLI